MAKVGKFHLNDLQSTLRRRLSAGIEAAAGETAQLFTKVATATDVTPDPVAWKQVRHRGKGDVVFRNGEKAIVDRSAPTEYPYRERVSGGGAEAIGSAVKPERLTARVGVRAAGWHLIHLSHGVHPVTRKKFNRLGLDDVFMLNQGDIRDAAMRAMGEL